MNEDEKKTIELYRALSPAGKIKALLFCKMLLQAQRENRVEEFIKKYKKGRFWRDIITD